VQPVAAVAGWAVTHPAEQPSPPARSAGQRSRREPGCPTRWASNC